MRRAVVATLLTVSASAIAACTAEPDASSVSPAATPRSTGTDEPSPPDGRATESPTATPEPPLSLELPDARDERDVGISVVPDVPPDGDGEIVVTLVNQSDAVIDEIVLRWPTDLRDTLFLAPFQPSPDRTREGGEPLVQSWTKWVEGPGERDEPAGTTSLGYGPVDPGMTLTFSIFVTRNAAGPVEFDLQVLDGNELLEIDDRPAELRVGVP